MAKYVVSILNDNEKVISRDGEEIYRHPYSIWGGSKSFIFKQGKTEWWVSGETYYDVIFVNLTTGKAYVGEKDRDSFLWNKIFPSPDGNILLVYGCVWGSHYHFSLFDVSDIENRGWPIMKINFLDTTRKALPRPGDDESYDYLNCRFPLPVEDDDYTGFPPEAPQGIEWIRGGVIIKTVKYFNITKNAYDDTYDYGSGNVSDGDELQFRVLDQGTYVLTGVGEMDETRRIKTQYE